MHPWCCFKTILPLGGGLSHGNNGVRWLMVLAVVVNGGRGAAKVGQPWWLMKMVVQAADDDGGDGGDDRDDVDMVTVVRR
ncbi:hypothetical protein Tco_0756516 [Tanacetum coccineum]